jgi:hypothetical protein
MLKPFFLNGQLGGVICRTQENKKSLPLNLKKNLLVIFGISNVFRIGQIWHALCMAKSLW